MNHVCRAAFEKECADWGLDFGSWNEEKESYDDYATGLCAGPFQLGWQTALDTVQQWTDGAQWEIKKRREKIRNESN